MPPGAQPGTPAAQIAQVLDIPVLTVRTRLFYARKEVYAAMMGDATLEALGRDLLRRSAPFRGLVKLLTRYNVSLDEIISQYGYGVRDENLGLGSDGRLVLLDSSIFPGR